MLIGAAFLTEWQPSNCRRCRWRAPAHYVYDKEIVIRRAITTLRRITIAQPAKQQQQQQHQYKHGQQSGHIADFASFYVLIFCGMGWRSLRPDAYNLQANNKADA